MAQIIDGKALKDKILGKLKQEVEKLEKKPRLVVILAGDDPASMIYVRSKRKTALELGFESEIINLEEKIEETELLKILKDLNENPDVNGILVQLPLALHIDTNKVIETIDPLKDVDCFHPYNAGLVAVNANPLIFPCTPKGIISLLNEYKIPIEGQNVVIVGRSNIVGRPLSRMFTNLNATVTLCHSKTKNLFEITKKADILVSAAGCPKFIKKEHVKKGAVVIDVGMNRVQTVEGSRLCGDVDFENVKDTASFITPVPGGVGPMTICSLMENTFELFKLQNGLK